MQNFVNNNYTPDISYFHQLDDPSQSEVFNKATHPAYKPIISKHIFAVDSRQRNYNIFPNANNYNIKIPDRYRNVTSIELKAAMLPRTEYNVNSSNKYLDVVIGDYISKIKAFSRTGPAIIKKNGIPYADNNPTTNVPLIIDPPNLSGEHIILEQAVIEVDLNMDSTIKSYNIINPGSGYSNSKPPYISLGDFSEFIVEVGKNYVIELREGQYTIGGNPQFTDSKNSTSFQSWVPSNLLCEMESAMTYAILKENGYGNASDYCYTRQSWTSLSNTSSPSSATKDYPLLFSSRLMSQYPNIDTYSINASGTRNNPDNYETNCCKYNRIYTTNSLIFKSTTLPTGTFTDDTGFEYDVLTYNVISGDSGPISYILYCKLTDPFQQVGGKFWMGLDSNDSTYKIAHWEFLFASGENHTVNSAGLFGYTKKNYYKGIYNIPIEVIHTIGTNNKTTLISQGVSYSADNDYYLVGDPEYVTLSFRSKYGDNSSINDRVDSQEDSNIDRVFACLIFDTVQPAVLQDISSGKTDTTIGSFGYDNNSLNSFLNYDNTLNEVKQLTGNTGNQNVSYNRPPGQLKAMKGADFDRKIVEFPQPIAQITDLNIRFTKFAKIIGQNTNAELYDFHGKEHLLLFEITCGDLMTGKRF